MTVPPLALAWLLLLPFVAGMAFLRGLGLRARDDRLAFAGWAWLAGTLALTLLLYVWSWFDLRAPRAAATSLLIAGALAAEFAARRASRASREPATPAPLRRRAAWWEEGIFGAALLLVVLVAFDRTISANAMIVCVSDESTIWAAKAKLFQFAGGMNDDFRRLLLEQHVRHADYPPMNPLLQWWTWLHGGGVVATDHRLPIQCTVVALLLAAAGALRRRVRPLAAAALLLLVGVNLGTATMTGAADSEPLVALGALVAVDAWLRFDESGARGHFALMSCGLATSLWAKNEGTLVAAAFAAALAAGAWLSPRVRARLLSLRGALAWLFLPLACEAAHRAFNLRYGLVNDLVSDAEGSFLVHLGARLDLASLRTLASWFGRTLFVPATLVDLFPAPESAWLRPSDQNLLIPAFAISILAAPRASFRGATAVVTAALLASVGGFALVYLATVHDLAWHLETSVGRVLFLLAPAAAVALAENFAGCGWFSREGAKSSPAAGESAPPRP